MPTNETSRAEEPPVLSDEEQAFRDQEAEYEAEARARLVRREEHLENFRRLVGSVAPELVERATQIHDADEFSMPFDAHERGGRVIVTFADIGNGVASSWDVTAFVYRGGQRTLQMSYGGFDGSYVQPLELDAPIDAALRADVEHVFETQLATGPQDPRFGLADLFVSAQQGAATRSGNGFAAVGPHYISRPRPRPAFPPPPR